MSQEDIIKMAREAGLAYGSDEKPLGSVIRFAALVAAAEREACAVLCDIAVEKYTSLSLQYDDEHQSIMEHANTCSYLADAIRARGDNE